MNERDREMGEMVDGREETRTSLLDPRGVDRTYRYIEDANC